MQLTAIGCFIRRSSCILTGSSWSADGIITVSNGLITERIILLPVDEDRLKLERDRDPRRRHSSSTIGLISRRRTLIICKPDDKRTRQWLKQQTLTELQAHSSAFTAIFTHFSPAPVPFYKHIIYKIIHTDARRSCVNTKPPLIPEDDAGQCILS